MSTNPRTSQAGSLPSSPGDPAPATTDGHVTQRRQPGTGVGAQTTRSRPALAPARSPGHWQAGPEPPPLRPEPGQDLPPGRMDAGGARLRLRALHVMGHGPTRIARALGVRTTTISQLVRGDATTISPHLHDAIASLYDTWWEKRAPERTPAERAAAAAARRRAIAGNWCAPAALDDDQLDTPGYRPQYGWKPATGTGVAPDICPPARHHQTKKDT